MTAVVAFASVDAASRRVAGVAAAARVARSLFDSGAERVVLAVPAAALSVSARADLDRLAAGAELADPDRLDPDLAGRTTAAPTLSAAAILRATGKAGDGPVSRWLNRPISRAISAVLLMLPGVRPLHATIGTALIALAMFAFLVGGGAGGLIAGGLLFHAASVFDGVDGEIARATFRSSPAGATLDGIVDVATNFLFVLGVTANLAARGVPQALTAGAWGLSLFAVGLLALAGSSARSGSSFSLDVLKQDLRRGPLGRLGPWLVSFLTIVTSRDFFALLFALLILAAVPMAILYIFAGAATVWIPFVAWSVLRWHSALAPERTA